MLVGDSKGIEIAEFGRYRAGATRLRGLRLIHTRFDKEGLTKDDITDLVLLRFDLLASLEVLDSGLPGMIDIAHLLPRKSGEEPLYETVKPLPFHRLDFDFLSFIESLEAEMEYSSAFRKTEDGGKRAILVNVTTGSVDDAEDSMDELASLAESADVAVLDRIIQRRKMIDGKYVMGSGKLKELFIRSLELDANLIVFDRELSGSQIRAVAEATEIEVIDRTQLILDIFAQRARTSEGKIQVELAQLRYSLPRLVLKDDFMSRITGGTGGIRARGPGETKLEISRRRIKERIARLERDIETMARGRDERRKKREQSPVPIVSVVGYTNAGKSTLLNTLTSSNILAEDRLFATLDPTTRRLYLPSGREIMLTDTVGFVKDLPADLLAAFRSTLEEMREADLLLHLFDASSGCAAEHIAAVNDILTELALDNIPQILVANKIDVVSKVREEELKAQLNCETISALERQTILPLLDRIEKRLAAVTGLSEKSVS